MAGLSQASLLLETQTKWILKSILSYKSQYKLKWKLNLLSLNGWIIQIDVHKSQVNFLPEKFMLQQKKLREHVCNEQFRRSLKKTIFKCLLEIIEKRNTCCREA